MSIEYNSSAQYLASKLSCQCVKSSYKYVDDHLFCENCKTTLQYQDNIYFSINKEKATNALEDLEYDLRHGTLKYHGSKMADNYMKHVARSGERLEVLEIGCGTGNVTVGLSKHLQVKHCIAVDISHHFLQTAYHRLKKHSDTPEKITLMCANVEDMPFSDNTFDVIIGNSFLHHIYDYKSLLIKLRQTLKPGGVLLFNEPCQQGKSLIAFFLTLILKQEENAGIFGKKVFSAEEREVIKGGIHVLTREQYVDRIGKPEIKKNMEDKHIFNSHEIMRLSSQLGFSDCQLFNIGELSDGYKGFVKNTLKTLRIDKDISRYDYLFEEFWDKYLYFMEDQTETPHRFFRFQK